ncbi:hypothetical protein OV079_03485 [Nannocystis pusilla]|uniref:Lipoprotein n=1 Tax=Nannocystis pusilla TaxID=889268 RepID=A0A9X3IV87_9BACT|nr:hypothetical protein [Nannocystis pusilla]MCY1004645.1 hypothetical protein [Nannocystis pusilla]
MTLWSRIPIVTLVLGAACQNKSIESAASTDSPAPGVTDSTSTASTDATTGSTTGTTDAPAWPPVSCSGVTCEPGEFCLMRPPLCQLVTKDPCYDDDYDDTDTDSDTGEPESYQCYDHVSVPGACLPVPDECLDDPDGVAACLERPDLCLYGGQFDDGVLACGYAFDHCEEGSPQHPSCKSCSPAAPA